MIQTIVDQNTLLCIYTVFTPAESALSTHFPKNAGTARYIVTPLMEFTDSGKYNVSL